MTDPTALQVVLTREPRDNALLRSAVEKAGFTVLEYPCIRTKHIPTDGEHLRKLLCRCTVAAFTSKRAPEALATHASFITDSRVFLAAVGATTAGAIQRIFHRTADIISAAQTGEDLAHTIARWCRSRRRHGTSPPDGVLHIRGTKYNPTFETILRRNGLPVSALEVYSTEPADIPPLPPAKRIVVFASPSAAVRFFQVNPPCGNEVYPVAIGPVTAEAIRGIMECEPVVPEAPQLNTLARTIVSLARKITSTIQ